MISGDLKSLYPLWIHLASNLRYRGLIDDRDIETFTDRATNEGLSFLTQGLPRIGKALDRFHATHVWTPPEGFSTRPKVLSRNGDPTTGRNCLVIEVPVFLGGAISEALMGNPTAVDCVRQLSYIFYKLEVKHESEVTEKFLDQFITIDQDLAQFWEGSEQSEEAVEACDARPTRASLISLMKGLIGRILCNADPKDIVPSHGSGATACRTPNYEKYHKLRYFKKLDDCFSYDAYFFMSPTHLADELELLEKAPHADPMARVVLVPKDSRGPRIISCEPAELMFIQQGLMRRLYETIENHSITRGQINFTDQTVNRDSARIGSLTNRLATLDLSDASDRVSLDLVRRVFPSNWVEALEASRSETTQLPNGKIVKLNKFAPMGSSCCFPVEALVFWACAQAALKYHAGMSSSMVLVYGDDIICDAVQAPLIMEALELIGLKVNKEKSYTNGPFRESCGGDFYLGVDVTPVRLRKFFGTSGTKLETTAEFCNNIIAKFGYESSHSIVTYIENFIGYQYPRTPLALPGTIRASLSASNDARFKRRWNKDYQRYEHLILKLVCKVKKHHPPNWGELLRKQLSKGSLRSIQDQYVNRLAIADAQLEPGMYTDPHSVRTEWVWTWLG